MFLGHFAVGLAAKRAAPETNLALLLLAALFLDVLWPLFLLAGIEHARIVPGITAVVPMDLYDYPYSHSLLWSAVWAAAFVVIYVAARRRVGPALVLAAAVLSHWVLDFVTHRPDMPLLPQGPYAGLELWRSVPATMAVESAMLIAGVFLYTRVTRSSDRLGVISFWSFIAVLGILYIASVFGPPPPSTTAVAVVGLIGSGLWIAWALWIERHRRPS